ncbi:hypothetical protein [Dentiradicibacter hellwigii]|uniref:Uncharacterized protein n=1 Tax=Dentiradicibacter hellwigii TaxID=3149053 RepID=A0ABV4UGZ2_9RHOO
MRRGVFTWRFNFTKQPLFFWFMFFDALNPTYLKGFRVFYVFLTVLSEFRGNAASLATSTTSMAPTSPASKKSPTPCWRRVWSDLPFKHPAPTPRAMRRGVFTWRFNFTRQPLFFWFMFFDALNPAYLKGFRAFYVFCLIFTEFRGNAASLNSGATLLKDKAQPTPYFYRETAISEGAANARRLP